MRLDLFDLQLFLHIADTGSMTKAAERSALSVQACSERIKKLEQRYSTLLIRRPSGVHLTPAGHVFARHAKLMLKQYQALQQDITPYLRQSSEDIYLWCNSSAHGEYLPKLLPQYLLIHRHINIHLKEAESSVIIQHLQHGTAHLGLISNVFDIGHLQTRLFIDDPLVLICHSTHELLQFASISLSQTLSYPWIGLLPQHALQQSIDQQLSHFPISVQYRLRVLNFRALAQVVSQQLGIAVMPARIARRLTEQFTFSMIPIEGKWANRSLQLACQSFDDLPPAYQKFSQFLLNDMQRQQI